MNFIKGFTFRLQEGKQAFDGQETKEALQILKEATASDTIMLAVVAQQDHPQSEVIDYRGSHMPTDQELCNIISYARELGLRVLLKPMVNCRNGVWRAHINFFDIEAPCEPKWANWFASYTEYLCHYAEIAEQNGCEMLVVGCELVQTERKETYWRELIDRVREHYSGLLTYNTDKYQEENVSWWDALDVISSSGYYPSGSWTDNIARIRSVVKRYQRPFFFAECGCPSRKGSAQIPNDWTHEGELDLQEQADYYREMFRECSKFSWINGFACWDWVSNWSEHPVINDDYSVYGKPAAAVIKAFYEQQDFL